MIKAHEITCVIAIDWQFSVYIDIFKVSSQKAFDSFTFPHFLLYEERHCKCSYIDSEFERLI